MSSPPEKSLLFLRFSRIKSPRRLALHGYCSSPTWSQSTRLFRRFLHVSATFLPSPPIYDRDRETLRPRLILLTLLSTAVERSEIKRLLAGASPQMNYCPDNDRADVSRILITHTSSLFPPRSALPLPPPLAPFRPTHMRWLLK